MCHDSLVEKEEKTRGSSFERDEAKFSSPKISPEKLTFFLSLLITLFFFETRELNFSSFLRPFFIDCLIYVLLDRETLYEK